jgi:predicted DNA-binding protein
MFYNMKDDAAMIAIRLDKEIERELDLLAERQGSNRSAVVREAILRYLEDNEDLEQARQAKLSTKSSKTLKQLRKVRQPEGEDRLPETRGGS